MSYIGRYRQDEWLYLLVQCQLSGAPQTPSDCPQAVLWAPDGTKLTSFQLPEIDRYAGVVGLFGMPYQIQDSRTGIWQIVYEYATPFSTAPGLEFDTFELTVSGRGANTQAMYYWNRPWAALLLQQLDGGAIRAKTNPKV